METRLRHRLSPVVPRIQQDAPDAVCEETRYPYILLPDRSRPNYKRNRERDRWCSGGAAEENKLTQPWPTHPPAPADRERDRAGSPPKKAEADLNPFDAALKI